MPHRNPFKPHKDHPSLDELIERTRHIVMTPEQQSAQRRSFEIGQLMLDHPEMSHAQATCIVDAVIASVPTPIHHPCCEKGRV